METLVPIIQGLTGPAGTVIFVALLCFGAYKLADKHIPNLIDAFKKSISDGFTILKNDVQLDIKNLESNIDKRLIHIENKIDDIKEDVKDIKDYIEEKEK